MERRECGRAVEYTKTIVYLVHGMWGRGMFRVRPRKEPRWFERYSAFFRLLSAELGGESPLLEVVPFNWSVTVATTPLTNFARVRGDWR